MAMLVSPLYEWEKKEQQSLRFAHIKEYVPQLCYIQVPALLYSAGILPV